MPESDQEVLPKKSPRCKTKSCGSMKLQQIRHVGWSHLVILRILQSLLLATGPNAGYVILELYVKIFQSLSVITVAAAIFRILLQFINLHHQVHLCKFKGNLVVAREKNGPILLSYLSLRNQFFFPELAEVSLLASLPRRRSQGQGRNA